MAPIRICTIRNGKCMTVDISYYGCKQKFILINYKLVFSVLLFIVFSNNFFSFFLILLHITPSKFLGSHCTFNSYPTISFVFPCWSVWLVLTFLQHIICQSHSVCLQSIPFRYRNVNTFSFYLCRKLDNWFLTFHSCITSFSTVLSVKHISLQTFFSLHS